MRLVSPQQQLDLFYSMPGDIAARDAQDLMSWPFFSLAKSRRSAPIDFAMGATWISVEAVAEHGMATIWDADILIWAARSGEHTSELQSLMRISYDVLCL